MIFRTVKTLDRSFFRFVTIHAFVRQTDGRTDEQLSRGCMQRGNKTLMFRPVSEAFIRRKLVLSSSGS